MVDKIKSDLYIAYKTHNKLLTFNHLIKAGFDFNAIFIFPTQGKNH